MRNLIIASILTVGCAFADIRGLDTSNLNHFTEHQTFVEHPNPANR